MNYEKEKEVFFSCCGSYCHTCDWFTGRIRMQSEGARRMLREFSIFPKLLGESGEKIQKAMESIASTSICSGCFEEGGGEEGRRARRVTAARFVPRAARRTYSTAPIVRPFPAKRFRRTRVS